MGVGITAAARVLKERQKHRNLPTVEIPRVEGDELARTLQGVQEHLRMYEGDSGAPKERFVTIAELENSGLIKSDVKSRFAYISQVLGKDVAQMAGSTANPTQTDPVKPDTSQTSRTPGTDSASSTAKLNDSQDVNVANPARNEFLYYDGNKFTNFPLFKKGNTWVGAQRFEKPVVLREQASGPEALGGLGYVWVKDDTPSTLWFTDDGGTEVQLGVGGAHTHVIADITDFTDNSINWDTAFGWGDHASGGYASSGHTHSELPAAGVADFDVLHWDQTTTQSWVVNSKIKLIDNIGASTGGQVEVAVGSGNNSLAEATFHVSSSATDPAVFLLAAQSASSADSIAFVWDKTPSASSESFNIEWGLFTGGTVPFQITRGGSVKLINGLHQFNSVGHYISEAPSATGDIAAFGQFWVRDDVPNVAMFTNDAGQDFVLNDVGATAQTITSAWASASGGSNTHASGFTDTRESGSTNLFEDNAELVFGTGSDAVLDFDGTNFVLNMVAGNFRVQGDVESPNTSAAEIGYRGSPINTQNGSYSLVLGDAGKTIRKATSTASITHTIPANASVAFPIGTLIAWHNDGTVDMTIAITTDTMTGTDAVTGSRTLGPSATAVIQKTGATTWKYAASDL